MGAWKYGTFRHFKKSRQTDQPTARPARQTASRAGHHREVTLPIKLQWKGKGGKNTPNNHYNYYQTIRTDSRRDQRQDRIKDQSK